MSISPTQLNSFRKLASRIIAQTFPTELTIHGHAPFPAARWGSTSSASPELAGLFTGCDIVFRIERTDIPVEIKAEKTQVSELGKTYRVEQIRDALGDPAIVIGCKAK
jgi:hypothetical protein